MSGLNQNVFINKLKKSGIELYNLKKKDNKTILLTINSGKSEKLFAISKELCYNVKKVRDSGRLYPLLYLYRNVGVLIGMIVLTFALIFSNDFVFSVDYSGTGSAYKMEANQILLEEGVGTFSRFSSLDLKSLSNKILSKSDKFSFVSIQKRGNRLSVYLSVANKSPETLTGQEKVLISNVSGRIESIKVYRGTPIKSVGESVTPNDVIAHGFVTVNDQNIFVGVIASVAILSTEEHNYFSLDNDNEKHFELLATESIKTGEVVSVYTNSTPTVDGYFYKITVTIRHRISIG